MLKRARLSLYFFSNAGSQTSTDYYDFLLKACEFADRAGFHAAWLPERHFVDFGGNSPNPALLASAVAARTSTLRIHAGSVAAPLHHAVRIAEEWAVVDGLSYGRAGVSFASGWHPDDFVLAAEPYEDRKQVVFRMIEQIRALWEGKSVGFPTTAGGERQVATMPRPVQPHLPMWLTAAENPESFAAAGTAGVGVMTALFGLSFAQLKSNIRRYREAWRAARHPGDGDVVVMAHAYVSDRPDLVDFLRPAVHSYLSAFRAQTNGTKAEQERYLESAFKYYLSGMSLLGSESAARDVLRKLTDAGADEVGCLVDFGLSAGDVLAGLPALARLADSAA